MKREDLINLLVSIGLLALAATGLWLIITFTPWLEALAFNPWWLMVPLVVLGVVSLVNVIRRSLTWDGEMALISLIFSILLVVLVAVNIGLGIGLKPWLEGLSFSPWWFALLLIPYGITTLLFMRYFDRVWDLEIGSPVLYALISLVLLVLVAGNIALVIWFHALFGNLAISPWGLLVPISLVCVFMILVSGWWEDLGYIPGIPAVILIWPVATVTAPVWGTIYALIENISREPELEQFEEELHPKDPWSDAEIRYLEQDSFYFQDYAKVLADRAEEAKPPLTIGVFGRWGSGKTSLMRLVQIMLKDKAYDIALDEKPPLETLWVNVWKLSNRPELWSAFVQSLLTTVHAKLPWYRQLDFDWGLFWKRLRWRAVFQSLLANSYRVLIAVAPFVLSLITGERSEAGTGQLLTILLDPITGGSASLILSFWLLLRPAVEAARETVSLDMDAILAKAPHEEQVSVLQELQEEFQRLVETWVGVDGRLVIFVDDLDRCSPNKIPEVLETLELFINTRQCVYVLGVDPDIVSEAVKTKNKYTDAGAIEYMEKIVQVPFHLPRLVDDSIVKFIQENYPDVVKDVGENLPEIFALGLERNPRKVKRALNVYRTLLDIIIGRNEIWYEDHEPELELVGKMVVIQSRFRALYTELVRNPSLLVGVERWAQLHGTDQPAADQEWQELDAWVERYVPVIGRPALAAMLKVGVSRFGTIKPGDLGVYVYLTSTVEDPTERYRPRREERNILLGNDLGSITSLVNDIRNRGSDLAEQEEINKRYTKKLKNVLRRPKIYDYYERRSANTSLKYLHDLWQGSDFEPECVWVPAGSFLIGRTGVDIRDLAEANIEFIYEEIFKLIRRQDGHEKLLEFTHLFVDDLKEEFKEFRPVLEGYHRPQLTPFMAPWGEGGFKDIFAGEARLAQIFHEKVKKYQANLDLPDYLISRYPVTNAQFSEFLTSAGSLEDPQNFYPYDDYPVVNVSWHDARAYCEWLSQQTGHQYRLPSEAEWEKAARGTSGRRFPWGESLGSGWSNNFAIESEEPAAPSAVGYFPVESDSPFLVADMIGNVWEWTSSLYEKYPYSPEDGRENLDLPGERVLRGGSYLDALDALACSTRHHALPDTKLPNIGFRVVMQLDDQITSE